MGGIEEEEKEEEEDSILQSKYIHPNFAALTDSVTVAEDSILLRCDTM